MGLLANMLHGLTGQLIVVALITIAADLAMGTAMGPVETIAFIGLTLRFMQTLEDLGSMVIANEERGVMIDQVNDILTTPALPEPANEAAVTKPGDVELSDVTFGYQPDTPVLRDVSMAVPAGTMCAIVGPSGCGKTTLAKLIARFHDVDAGVVRVGGVDVRDQPTAQLMAQLSMVFQDVYLFDDTLGPTFVSAMKQPPTTRCMPRANWPGSPRLSLGCHTGGQRRWEREGMLSPAANDSVWPLHAHS